MSLNIIINITTKKTTKIFLKRLCQTFYFYDLMYTFFYYIDKKGFTFQTHF